MRPNHGAKGSETGYECGWSHCADKMLRKGQRIVTAYSGTARGGLVKPGEFTGAMFHHTCWNDMRRAANKGMRAGA